MNEETKTLTEIIPFRNQDLTLFTRDRAAFAALRPICEGMGMDWSAQYRRIQRHEFLNQSSVIMATTGADGKQYEMVCLPVELIPFWLATAQPSRVDSPEAKQAIIEYQRDVARVLFEHYIVREQKSSQKLLQAEHILKETSFEVLYLKINAIFKTEERFSLSRRMWWLKQGHGCKGASEKMGFGAGTIGRWAHLYDSFTLPLPIILQRDSRFGDLRLYRLDLIHCFGGNYFKSYDEVDRAIIEDNFLLRHPVMQELPHV